MKLWHDDVRPAPEGWVWARTNDDARRHLATGEVEEISMDHDLGYDGPPPGQCEECGGTGSVRVHSSEDYGISFECEECAACDGDGFIGGDVMYIAGTADDDGYALAQWMVQTGHVPDKITIHSWNPAGAENMRRCFKQAGHACLVEPYSVQAMLDLMRPYMERRRANT